MLTHCYLCNEELTQQNKSAEHVIPNSIGGRLKSKFLICEICNNNTGRLFDDDFADFIKPLAVKYNFKRDKGNVRPVGARELGTNHPLTIRPGNMVEYQHPLIVDVSEIRREILTNNQADFDKTVKRLKKLDDVGYWEIGEQQSSYGNKVQWMLETIADPETVLRSVCKTMCNIHLHFGGDISTITRGIEFIVSEIENHFCWFYDLHLSQEQFNGKPYHTVVIRSDKKQRAVYAYFEVFGEKGFVALLNGRYEGTDTTIRYVYDPISRTEIATDFDFSLNVGELITIIQQQPRDPSV